MKILVCIKDIPDNPAAATIAEGEYPRYEGFMVRRMDRLSEYALELALTLKDSKPETVIDTVCVGPETAAGSLKRSLEMGADRAFRIDSSDADTWHPERVAAALADFTRGCGYDLICTGVMSEDLMQGITGALVAEELGLVTVPAVMDAGLEKNEENRLSLFVTCELEGGRRAEGRCYLPAHISVQSGPRPPRYPSLTNKLRARQQEVNPLPFPGAALSLPSGELIFERPERSALVTMIEGTPDEKARRLFEIFHDEGVL